MARVLKFLALGLVLLAAGVGLLRLNFYAGLGTVFAGVLVLGWFQGEFLRQFLLWNQRIHTKPQKELRSPTHMSRATSAASPYVINNPTIGFLNLTGDEGERLAKHDFVELSSEFEKVREIESGKIPKCDVLILYCALDPRGKILGQSYSLRDVLRAAGARIAVIASDIPHSIVTSSEFNRFLQSKNDWPANVIITLNRNGEAFGRFFKNLFSEMHAGTTMPKAWVKLAPQGPVSNADHPGTVALLEAGHIAFAVA